MSEFEKKALRGIPSEILNSMSRELNTTAEGFATPLEAIMANRKKMTEPAKPIIPEVPQQQKKPNIVVIDNRAIEVPADPYQSLMVMVAYYMATVGYKDEKIAKILKAFKFQMADANNEPIYPPKKKKK